MKIQKKHYYYIAGGIILAVLIFYGGMMVGKAQPGQTTAGGNQQRGTLGGGFTARNGAGGGGMTSGKIVSVDSQGITVQLQNGSSKIILIPSSVSILKSTAGSTSDLTQGEQVTVSGSANSDGSITAQMVQIRPAGQINQMPGNPSSK